MQHQFSRSSDTFDFEKHGKNRAIRRSYLEYLWEKTANQPDPFIPDCGSWNINLVNTNRGENYFQPHIFAASTDVTYSKIVNHKISLFEKDNDRLICDNLNLSQVLQSRYNSDLPMPQINISLYETDCEYERCQECSRLAIKEIERLHILSRPGYWACCLLLFKSAQLYTELASKSRLDAIVPIALNRTVETACAITNYLRELFQEIAMLKKIVAERESEICAVKVDLQKIQLTQNQRRANDIIREKDDIIAEGKNQYEQLRAKNLALKKQMYGLNKEMMNMSVNYNSLLDKGIAKDKEYNEIIKNLKEQSFLELDLTEALSGEVIKEEEMIIVRKYLNFYLK